MNENYGDKAMPSGEDKVGDGAAVTRPEQKGQLYFSLG